MRMSTLTEVTCIEELMAKFSERETFEKEVFNLLFNYYTKGFQHTDGSTPEDERRKLFEFKLDQRCAIQLIRMIGQSEPKIITSNLRLLKEKSLKFAEMDKPDFILMKEALITIEKVLIDK